MSEELNVRAPGRRARAAWDWPRAGRRMLAACALGVLLAGCGPAAQAPLPTPTPPDPSPLPRSPVPTGTPLGRTYLPSVAGPPPSRTTYLPSVQQRPPSGTPVYLPVVPNSRP
jgi:hypothetical protein